jgi:hypothetical protein
MFLSTDQLAELTGYKVAYYQVRWLRARGWTFEVGGDGRPKVLVAHAMRRLGGVDSTAPTEPKLRLG